VAQLSESRPRSPKFYKRNRKSNECNGGKYPWDCAFHSGKSYHHNSKAKTPELGDIPMTIAALVAAQPLRMGAIT
jgi:hypothetical protein